MLNVLTVLIAAAALAAAVWAAWESHKLRLIEAERDREARLAQEMEQASCIAAWPITLPDRPRTSADAYGLRVVNRSQTPVFNVSIDSTDGQGHPVRPCVMNILPPGDFVVLRHETYVWAFPEECGAMTEPVRPITRSDKWRVEALAFLDASNHAWRRGADGVITSADV